MKMKMKGGDWFFAKQQFERLPSFCFFCGIIGHSEQACEKLYDNPSAEVNPLLYGLHLRASAKKSTVVNGSRWIRQGCRRPAKAAGGVDSIQVDSASSHLGKSLNNPINSGINNADQIPELVGLSKNVKVNKGSYDKSDSLINGNEDGNIEDQDGKFVLDSKRKRIEVLEGGS